MKTKVPYFSILIAVFLLSLLIAIIPFSGKKERREETKIREEPDATRADLSATDILSSAIKAHGGADALRGLRSVRMRTASTLLAESGEKAEENAFYRFPDAMRSEANIGGAIYIQAYFHGSAWIMSDGKVRDADPGTTEFLRRSLKHFPSYLLTAVDPSAVTLMRGTSFTEGKSLHTIAVIDAESDETVLCISPEDFLVKRMEYSIFAEVTEEHVRLDLSDFRQESGVILPYKVDITVNGVHVQETNVRHYDLNIPLPDSLFEKPGE